MNTTSLNSRERKAQRLLAHYSTCDRLAAYLRNLKKCPKCVVPQIFTMHPSYPEFPQIDGKKISVALFKAEFYAQKLAEDQCNKEVPADSLYTRTTNIRQMVINALGTLSPGFFVNSDPRGYALKIDNETEAGRNLINHAGLPTDMGGYGILSPEINGDR